MHTNKMYCYLVCFVALFLLAVPALSSAVEMEILSRVDLSTERRHAWNPWVVYNSDKDEFFVIWNSTGKLRDDCDPADDYECTKSFQSIEAARVAPSGEILANLQIVPPKGPKDDVTWIASPRIAYNPVNKEYLGLYDMSTDTCVQCHERNTQTGEVYPADVSKCIACHPGDGPGLCNLVSFIAELVPNLMPVFESADLQVIAELLDKIALVLEKFALLSIPVQWALIGLGSIGGGAYLLKSKAF